MPSDDISNQYHLFGENTPIWLILGLLLAGIIGSVTTAQLLLSSGLNMESLRSWATQLNLQERAPKPLPAAVNATDLSIVSTPQSSVAESASLDIEATPSRQDSYAAMQEATSLATPSVIDTKTVTKSPDAVVESQASVMENPAKPTESEGQHEPSLVALEMAIGTITSTSDEDYAVPPEVKPDNQRVVRTAESDDIGASSAPVTNGATEAETLADLATDKPLATASSAEVESTTAEAPDCAPLFDVLFERDEIRAVDLDLDEKTTKLRNWLSRHPEAKLLIEGHTDSSGPEELNLLISLRRAKTVAELLASGGIPHTQMEARAFGERSPLTGLSPAAKRNRRVSLRIEGGRACPKATDNGEEQ